MGGGYECSHYCFVLRRPRAEAEVKHIGILLEELSPINPKRARASVPGFSSLYHSTRVFLHPLSYKALQCHMPHNDISYQAAPSAITSLNNLQNKQDQRSFLYFHRLPTALKGPLPTAGHDQFHTTFLAHVPLSNFIRHVLFYLLPILLTST